MSCDLTSGRLRQECFVGRAGIKKLFIVKYNDYAALTGVTESGGEITSLGADPITLYQFEMGTSVGNFEEVATVDRASGTAFITQTITLSLYYIKPADLGNLNALKKGRWAIWAMDYEDKIRFFGQTRGMVATSGSDVSGAGPSDRKGLDLVLTGISDAYAPFMQDFTTEPFDNYANVYVTTTGYGPELFTYSNAAADPNGTEANATTGFTPYGHAGNVWQSQSGVVNVGSYAIEFDAMGSPLSSVGFSLDLESAPFNFTNGKLGRLLFDWRQKGVGATTGQWDCWFGSYAGDQQEQAGTVQKTDTTFASVEKIWTHDANHRYLMWREFNPDNDGGIYLDNVSIRST